MTNDHSPTDRNAPVLRVGEREETTVGNYFVANYPPFSFWQRDAAGVVLDTVAGADADVPFGLYVHIPFCRKRCDFCYFRVYTGKNSKDVRRYVDAVLAELALYAGRDGIRGRRPQFIYFGGGTPSYLSVRELERLFDGLRAELPWDGVEEVTFECEPGTLEESKIQTLRDLGVTRLSLGVENFDPEILEMNNRAHRADEIHRTYGFARDVGFPQINLDLIAGMVGESDENWQDVIAQTRRLAPDSVTIYQMEVPYNTTIYRRMKDGGEEVAPVADWATKRRWAQEAFDGLRAGGYHVGSAYTASKGDHVRFLYRDGLWHGADLLGVGVASFSHVAGMHFQNEHDLGPYLETVEKGELPIHRGLTLSDDERLIREFVLQLKLGRTSRGYFHDKFGVDVSERFREALAAHEATGMISLEGDDIVVDPVGLLRIDTILEDFFLEEHRRARYA